jgi:biotin operon repressor
MDVKNFNSSYKFTPKAPDNWLSKKYKRSERDVNKIFLKSWQKEAHMVLRDHPLGFIKAFCGSGKTIATRSIAAYKAYKNGNMQIFCVPKNDIGNDGFASYFEIDIPWGKGTKSLSCAAPTNFCNYKVVRKINELIDLMLDYVPRKGKDLVDKNIQIICTHQCLTLAFRKIKERARKDPSVKRRFIANKTFWIDEAQYIKGHETKEEKEEMNLLGKFSNFVLDNLDTGVELFAMTATPFRGDYSNLFSAEQMNKFALYNLDFLDHFPTLGIKDVQVEFEEYADQEELFEKVSENIAEELDRRHFVFVPSTGRKWRKDKRDVQKLFDAIYDVIMRERKVDLATAKSLVLDLVTESTQSRNEKLLRQEPKNGQSKESKYIAVVCCMKCRVGSDWCPADRLHNTSMEDSPPLNFQTNGRLFRAYAKKEIVKIRYYVGKFKSVLKSRREFISDRVNAMLHYMLVDDLLSPILVDIPIFIPSAPKSKSDKVELKRKYTTLEDIFGATYQKAKKDLLERMGNLEFDENHVNKAVIETINKYLVNKSFYNKKQLTEVKLALKTFLLRARSSKLRKKGIDISFVRENGFDVVVEKEGLHGNMFASNLNEKEFKRFRETIKELEYTEEDKVAIAKGFGVLAAKDLGISVKSLNPRLKDHEEAIKKISTELTRIHSKYKEVAKIKGFSANDLAKALGKSEAFVQKRIKEFNKLVMPDGYKFDFASNSKLAKVSSKGAA